MLDITMNVTYKVISPKEGSTIEKETFLKLLKEQGQVANPTLEKISSCPHICIAYYNEMPIAIGAIKQVYTRPFDYAKIPDLKNLYPYELGYVYVIDKEEYRNKGIAKTICKRLLAEIPNQNVFSTTEEADTNSMKQILLKLGFVLKGDIYKGAKTQKNIGLYLLQHL